MKGVDPKHQIDINEFANQTLLKIWTSALDERDAIKKLEMCLQKLDELLQDEL